MILFSLFRHAFQISFQEANCNANTWNAMAFMLLIVAFSRSIIEPLSLTLSRKCMSATVKCFPYYFSQLGRLQFLSFSTFLPQGEKKI